MEGEGTKNLPDPQALLEAKTGNNAGFGRRPSAPASFFFLLAPTLVFLWFFLGSLLLCLSPVPSVTLFSPWLPPGFGRLSLL
jgi:hypothetical protein